MLSINEVNGKLILGRKKNQKLIIYVPVFPTLHDPKMSIRNGLGFVCKPIFANDDLGDVEFIVVNFYVFSTIKFAN